MKKINPKIQAIFILLVWLIILTKPALAILDSPSKYDQLYNSLQETDYEFINGEDPYGYTDQLEYTTSPYPLIRLTADYQSQDTQLGHGFYLLTARELNGKDFVLFKQWGKVVAAVPVFKKEPIDVKKEFPKPPPPKVSWWKKPWVWIKSGFSKLFGKYRKPPDPINCKMKAYDLDHKYYGIELIYIDHRYYLILKKL